jgi:FkbM family methyltransferase
MSEKYSCSYNGDVYLVADKVCSEYINSGKAEPYSGNIDFVKSVCQKRNNTYLDIGANMGTHTVVYSKLFKNVISFEPDIINYNLLQHNIQANNVTNATLHNKALSSVPGMVSTITHSNHSRGCIYTVEGGTIESITLDSLNLENIDYIKIDVEGHELDVLQSAVNTIRKNKPIIEFEYNGLSEKLFGVKREDISIFLTDLGYIFIKRIDDNFIYSSSSSAL